MLKEQKKQGGNHETRKKFNRFGKRG